MPVALATRMPRLAGVAVTLSLLAGCHPEPPWGFERWKTVDLENLAAGGTVDLELYRHGDPAPGLGSAYPVRIEGPFEVAATTADGMTLRATGPGTGRLEVLNGTDVIMDEPLAALAVTDLEITMSHIVHRTAEHPAGQTVLLGASFDVTARTVNDGAPLLDESATLTISGAERSFGSWGPVEPAEAGIVTIEYRSADQTRELSVEIVPTIHEITVIPGRDAATVCFEPRYEGSAVTGVPLQITAPVPLRLGPAYCAAPTAGPYPVEITARHGAIAATASVP
jgi:hypothetical protein